MTSLTVAADIRSFLGPVRDQGRRYTCLAFSAATANEHAHKLKDQLSVEWLFYHAVKGTPARAGGGITIAEACTTAEQDGQPDEQYWPYTKTLDVSQWKLPAFRPTKIWRAIAGPVNAAVIVDRLNAGTPIVIALVVGAGFVRGIGKLLQNEQILDDDHEPIAQGEGHAVVAVGHGAVGASPHLLVRNSWGAKWGKDGYAWIGVDEVKRRWIGGFELGAKQ